MYMSNLFYILINISQISKVMCDYSCITPGNVRQTKQTNIIMNWDWGSASWVYGDIFFLCWVLRTRKKIYFWFQSEYKHLKPPFLWKTTNKQKETIVFTCSDQVLPLWYPRGFTVYHNSGCNIIIMSISKNLKTKTFKIFKSLDTRSTRSNSSFEIAQNMGNVL
jgi:hypothetical protein